MQSIELTLSCSYTTATEPTRRICEVASMFGLGVDRQRTIAVVPEVTLPITPASIVFITGASGGGKSTLLRLIGEQLRGRAEVRVVEFGGSGLRVAGCAVRDAECGVRDGDPHTAHRTAHPAPSNPHNAIVEAIGGHKPHRATLEQAVRWLSLAGLNDAFVMLRKVSELSDGQRYRFALACAMAEAEAGDALCGMRGAGCGPIRKPHSASRTPHSATLTVVLADEFGSTLDRMTAKVVARNVRKWVARNAVRDAECGVRDADPQAAPRTAHGAVCFIAATAHDDLLEALEPDVLVVQEPGEEIGVHLRERNDE